MAKARHESIPDRILSGRHHDRNRASGLLRRPNRNEGARHKHVHRQLDEFTSKQGQIIPISLGVSVLDGNVRAERPSEAAEATLERFPLGERIVGRRIAWGKDTDSRYFPRWLRLGGERRGEKAASEHRHEGAPLHRWFLPN